jgi:hypothetical protein
MGVVDVISVSNEDALKTVNFLKVDVVLSLDDVFNADRVVLARAIWDEDRAERNVRTMVLDVEEDNWFRGVHHSEGFRLGSVSG